MCVSIFSTTFIWNISHSKKTSGRYRHRCKTSSCKVPLFLSDFNETWIFSIDFQENSKISNLIKIRSVRAELFHADGCTDITKLIVALRNFANAPGNQSVTNVWGNNLCLFWNLSENIKCSVWSERRICELNLVVHIVTTGI